MILPEIWTKKCISNKRIICGSHLKLPQSVYTAFYSLSLSPPFKQLCSDLARPHPLSTCITTYNLRGFSVFFNTPMSLHETHGGLVSVWHVNRLQLINTSINSYFARSAKLPQQIPLKSNAFYLQLACLMHMSVYLTMQADLKVHWEKEKKKKKNPEEDRDWRKTGERWDTGAGNERRIRRQNESKNQTATKRQRWDLGKEWKNERGDWSENKTVCYIKSELERVCEESNYPVALASVGAD